MAFRRGSRKDVAKREFTESMDVTETPSFASAASGYLEKRAKTPPYLWQKRYFVASGHYCRYYADEGCGKLLAAIELNEAVVAESGAKALCITTKSGEKIQLRATTAAEAGEWVAALVIMQRGLAANSQGATETPLADSEAPETAGGGDLARKSEAVIKVDRSGSGATPGTESSPGDNFRDSMLVTPRASFPAAAAGFLHKKASSSFVLGWQLRFFVGVGHYLRYYASDEPGSPVLGAFDVASVEVVGSGVDDPDDDGVVATFALRMADGNVQLRAASADERAQWVTSLRAMQANHGAAASQAPDDAPALDPADVALAEAQQPPADDDAADKPPPPAAAAPPADKRRLCGQCAIF